MKTDVSFSTVPIMRDVRRAAIMAVLATIFHALATTASRKVCRPWPYGYADGMPQELVDAGQCVRFDLEPSLFILIAVPAILAIALMRLASRPAAGPRNVERAVVAMWVLVGVAFVVTRAWLLLHGFPQEGADGYWVIPPVPFGSIRVEDVTLGWISLI